MVARYKTVDREQLMLLPYDLKEWIPENDIIHFVIEAVKAVTLLVFRSKVLSIKTLKRSSRTGNRSFGFGE
jgi:hypothetical protein